MDRPAKSASKSRVRRLPGNHVLEVVAADGSTASMGRFPTSRVNPLPNQRRAGPRYSSGKLSVLCSFTPSTLVGSANNAKTAFRKFFLSTTAAGDCAATSPWHGVCELPSADGVRDFGDPAVCFLIARSWQEEDMKPLQIAAQFAAFAWYTEHRQAPSRIIQAEARRFSNQNWQLFLSVAPAGWGRLLLRVAKARPNSQHRPAVVSRPRKRQLAAAV